MIVQKPSFVTKEIFLKKFIKSAWPFSLAEISGLKALARVGEEMAAIGDLNNPLVLNYLERFLEKILKF